jgi:hypothetical protein
MRGRFPFSGAFPLPLNRLFRRPFAVPIPIPIRRGALSFLFPRLWNSSLKWESRLAGRRGCVRSLPDSVLLLSVDAIDCLLSDKEMGF